MIRRKKSQRNVSLEPSARSIRPTLIISWVQTYACCCHLWLNSNQQTSKPTAMMDGYRCFVVGMGCVVGMGLLLARYIEALVCPNHKPFETQKQNGTLGDKIEVCDAQPAANLRPVLDL